MKITEDALQIIIWIFMRFVGCIFAIAAVFRSLKKPKRCPPIHNNVLLQPAISLAEKIRRKEITCEFITKAYISRIKEVDPVINAIVEENFAAALEQAKYVDALIANDRYSTKELQIKYPLLGVPLTVKESIAVLGLSNNAGRVLPDRPKATKDADIVKMCREAGAIILAVSNTPELCMNWETTNKSTGTTLNPYDTRRTAGGSSGGEAALLGSAASVISLGSDICGSLRLPPLYCGVWGHKPTAGAVSFDGHYPVSTDAVKWTQVFSLGPMARYAVDLPLLLDIIAKPNLRTVLRLNEPVNMRNIKIRYMENDGGSLLAHKISRHNKEAMRKVVAHMEKQGYQIERVQIPELKNSGKLSFLGLLDIDNVENLFDGNGNGAFTELFTYMTCRSRSMLTCILYGILKKISSKLPKSYKEKMYEQLSLLSTKLNEVLGNDGVLLYPSFPGAAPYHGELYHRVLDTSYMGIFNVTGLPATNCPVGLNSEGMPIGIQVVAAAHNDRLTLAVAQEIEKAFGGWTPPPCDNKNINSI